MTRTNTLGHHVGETIDGQYMLTSSVERVTQMGDRFKVLNLADCVGSVPVYAWEQSGLLQRLPTRTPVPIQASLYVRRLHGEIIANLQAVCELDTHEIDNAAALLIRGDCPAAARPALAKLVDFVGALEPSLLRQFLNRVLADPRIAPGITTCRGSQKHHHREQGGLLRHSVEVMEIAGDMASERLSPSEKAITQVAALLHDFGKLRAIGSGTTRPTHYLLVSHEAQTTRMLDPHIEWLRDRSPQIAAALDYTLEFLGKHVVARGRAMFIGADLVSAADRMSAALDNHKGLENLLARTLPTQQCNITEVVLAHHRWRKPVATERSHNTATQHEPCAARRPEHPANSKAQKRSFPWI